MVFAVRGSAVPALLDEVGAETARVCPFGEGGPFPLSEAFSSPPSFSVTGGRRVGLAAGARDPEPRSQVGCPEREASIVEGYVGLGRHTPGAFGALSAYRVVSWGEDEAVPRP